MYLCCWDEIMAILLPGKSKETFNEVRKCIWLTMLVAALKGLPYYNVELKKWGQAHIWDRWVIFQVTSFLPYVNNNSQVILETKEVVKINWKGDNDFEIEIDYSKILTVGKEAMGRFLQVFLHNISMIVYSFLRNFKSTKVRPTLKPVLSSSNPIHK